MVAQAGLVSRLSETYEHQVGNYVVDSTLFFKIYLGGVHDTCMDACGGPGSGVTGGCEPPGVSSGDPAPVF